MSTPTSNAPSRRHLLAGAGAVGAAAVAATTLPLAKQAAAPVAAAPAAAASVEQGGYQVTAHVLRYYQTARV
jgi:hypothetical protein